MEQPSSGQLKKWKVYGKESHSISMECPGLGMCWKANGKKERHVDMICSHNCELKACANAKVCGKFEEPEWVVHFKHGVCVSCSSDFGKVLTFSEDECPTCYEITECVTLPNCNHKQCISCFKRCRYGIPPPRMPENEEVILQWMKEVEHWLRQKETDEMNLRVCPLCRK